MNKNKLPIIILIFYLSIFALPFLIEFSYVLEDMQLNPFDYARITEVDYRAVVVDEPYSQGKVIVTERLTFDIHAASKNNLFWELWRDLCEDYIDGVHVYYKVNSVKQILKDGTEIIYSKSPKLYCDDYDYVSTNPYLGPGKWYHSPGPYNEDADLYECVFFYVDGLYREEVVFEIEYEMYNACLRYNDCSDLYLPMYSDTTINHLESFKAEILFPNKDMPKDGNYEVYTYGTNSWTFPVEESATKHPGYYTFSFELDEDDLKFRPYSEFIEFELVSYNDDKHIFTENAPSNRYSKDDVLIEIRDEYNDYVATPKTFERVKLVILIVTSILGVLILIHGLKTDSRMRTKHVFFDSPMDYEYYRDIPSDLDPKFASELVFCKHKEPNDDSGVYSAILLSLARKKYIELDDLLANDVRIIIKKPHINSDIQTLNQVTATLASQGITSPTPTYNFGAGQQSDPFAFETGQQSDPFAFGTGQPSVSFGFGAEPQSASYDNGTNIEENTYEPLTPCESFYYNLLVRHARNDEIFMSNLQAKLTSDYENTDTFAKNVANSVVNIGISEDYFQKASYKQPKKSLKASATGFLILGIISIILPNIVCYQTPIDFAFGGFFIFGICCIISSVIIKKQAGKYVLLTQFGENEYAKWRGLYNFLNSETLISERTFIELPIWEKYLVYATAFGLSEKVIKAIGIRCPEVNDSPVLSSNYCRSGRFRSSGRSFSSSVRTGSSFARSGGYGYGGGGRGGGGGGGGH